MTDFTDLRQALDKAGKLKQLCGAVLEVIGAAEGLVSMEQTCTETQARLTALREQEQRGLAVVEDLRLAIEQAKRDAKAVVAEARATAERVVREARETGAALVRDAEQTVAAAKDTRARVEAEIAVHRTTVLDLQRATQQEQTALTQARAAIEALLKR